MATSESVTALMEHYPGPALCVSRAGAVLSANTAAQSLINLTTPNPDMAPWLEDIATWMTQYFADGSGEGDFPNIHTTAVNTPDDIVYVEWSATRMDEDESCLLLGRERTFERNLTSALRESRERHRELIDVACDFAWETDVDGNFTYISPPGALDYDPHDMAGKPVSDFLVEVLDPLNSPFLSMTKSKQVELWLKRKDGEKACVVVSALPVFDNEGNWCGARGVCRDITEHHRQISQMAEKRTQDRMISHILQQLQSTEKSSTGLSNTCSSLILAFGAEGCLTFTPDQRHDYQLDEAALMHEGLWLEAICHGDTVMRDPSIVPQALKSGTTAIRTIGQSSVMIGYATYEDKPNCIMTLWRSRQQRTWSLQDLNFFRQFLAVFGPVYGKLIVQERLRRLSEIDGLTKLYNQRAFMETLQDKVSTGDAEPSVLLYLDLNNFKTVNDTLGHAKGDQIIMDVADIIRNATRGSDIGGRIGGDEFVVWLANATISTASHPVNRIIEAVEQLSHALPVNSPKKLGVSVGMAEYVKDESLPQWMARADQAMYQSKRQQQSSHMAAS